MEKSADLPMAGTSWSVSQKMRSFGSEGATGSGVGASAIMGSDVSSGIMQTTCPRRLFCMWPKGALMRMHMPLPDSYKSSPINDIYVVCLFLLFSTAFWNRWACFANSLIFRIRSLCDWRNSFAPYQPFPMKTSAWSFRIIFVTCKEKKNTMRIKIDKNLPFRLMNLLPEVFEVFLNVFELMGKLSYFLISLSNKLLMFQWIAFHRYRDLVHVH